MEAVAGGRIEVEETIGGGRTFRGSNRGRAVGQSVGDAGDGGSIDFFCGRGGY
jgi:hypothetical protein